MIIKLGITGHQDIGTKSDIEWVRESIDKIVSEIHSKIHGYSSIAVGADQLFCNVLISKNIDYTVIIPCKNYKSIFNDEKEFEYFISNADEEITLEYSKPSEEAFYEAGKKIVDTIDILIAVWNGKPAKGLGGTGDVVNYARHKGIEVLHINNLEKSVNKLTN